MMMPSAILGSKTIPPSAPSRASRIARPKPVKPIAHYLEALEEICHLPAHLAIREVVPVLAHLAKERPFANPHLLLPPDSAGSRNPRDPYIAYRREGKDNSYALQLFVWPAGAASQIHDHSCWGAISCISGSLMEKRYDRIDDGSTPNQAHLKKAWQQVWKSGQGISTLLPYDGGIHQVSNPTNATVLSLHIYGPMGAIDGRDYDPLHDYVCDRLVGD
ncbi:MAG TPA: cysteine dioxygenase family protein [Chloroflexia bacterium]|nr:cysteine dioxygenase family protein [Chloroflexia bacterium]